MASYPPQEALSPFYQKIYSQATTLSQKFLLGFFGLGAALALFYDTWLLGLVLGGGSLLLYFLIQYFYAESDLVKYIVSFLYGNFLLQFVLQMHGLYEMHFVYFVTLTLLLFYENWKVLIPVTIHGVVSVFSLFLLQNANEQSIYLSDSKPFTTISLVFHIGIMIGYSGVCVLWSIMQRKQTRESAITQLKMNEQLQTMEVNISFANSISQGNLNAQYPSTNPDALGQSLINMRGSLTEAKEREEKERFLTTGLAQIGEILRRHADSLEQLCDQVTEEIVKYVKANQGSMFIVEGAGTTDEHLRLVACRAWDRKKFLQKRIDIGQGLVGQAAIEKQSVFMTKVPNNYVRITSGLGEANPNCILIVPLKSEEQVVGVMELASFKVFTDTEKNFMEKVGESIAATIITTRNNQKNKELLEQSNMMAEQMKAQEEEMRQNMEEMHATQEEMERKNKEIENLLHESNKKEEELNVQLKEIAYIKEEEQGKNSKMLEELSNYRKTLLSILDQLPHKIFLKDQEGKMVLVNTAVAKAHNMTIDELTGKSDFDFVDKETAQQWRNQELEIIRKGSETYVFNDTISGEQRTLKTTKSAFYIPHLKQTGLLGIQTDITELQNLKDQFANLEKKA